MIVEKSQSKCRAHSMFLLEVKEFEDIFFKGLKVQDNHATRHFGAYTICEFEYHMTIMS